MKTYKFIRKMIGLYISLMITSKNFLINYGFKRIARVYKHGISVQAELGSTSCRQIRCNTCMCVCEKCWLNSYCSSN